jgi:hypothetical protein
MMGILSIWNLNKLDSTFVLLIFSQRLSFLQRPRVTTCSAKKKSQTAIRCNLLREPLREGFPGANIVDLHSPAFSNLDFAKNLKESTRQISSVLMLKKYII